MTENKRKGSCDTTFKWDYFSSRLYGIQLRISLQKRSMKANNVTFQVINQPRLQLNVLLKFTFRIVSWNSNLKVFFTKKKCGVKYFVPVGIFFHWVEKFKVVCLSFHKQKLFAGKHLNTHYITCNWAVNCTCYWLSYGSIAMFYSHISP